MLDKSYTGVLGLYGGLASKIACSAPISAIYTLTYEIVKGSLLPILPKVTICSFIHFNFLAHVYLVFCLPQILILYYVVTMPFLQEYHSIAHCTAGGCSSIATSFVFTPSECIKQQMQVGSQYQNCWYTISCLILIIHCHCYVPCFSIKKTPQFQ